MSEEELSFIAIQEYISADNQVSQIESEKRSMASAWINHTLMDSYDNTKGSLQDNREESGPDPALLSWGTS